jgi:hypothetical protein
MLSEKDQKKPKEGAGKGQQGECPPKNATLGNHNGRWHVARKQAEQNHRCRVKQGTRASPVVSVGRTRMGTSGWLQYPRPLVGRVARDTPQRWRHSGELAYSRGTQAE